MTVVGQYRVVLVGTWCTGSVEGGARSVLYSKGRQFLGVRLKRSEMGQFSVF